MRRVLDEKEQELEEMRLKNQIQDQRTSMAEKKAMERRMKKLEGRDWKRVLGLIKGLKPDREVLQDFYGVNPALREGHNPRGFRRG